MVLLLLVALRYGSRSATLVTALPFQPSQSIIWLADPGPGGGGGGGGNSMKDPPRQAEMPGKDRLTVPVSKPPDFEAPRQARTEPNPIEQLAIPARSLAAAADLLPGVLEAPAGPPTTSQGSGTQGGAGTGRGPGIGPGNGPGLGPGDGGNFGGGPYHIGSGVTPPIEIHKGTPQYTVNAMHARIQGSALVECVVQTDGICTDIRVVRSLDRSFGLDQEAIKAAQLWRFRPGMRFGQPVPVVVTIEVGFTLR
jgi:protein TonB